MSSQVPREPSQALLFVGSYNASVPHAPKAHGAGIQVFEMDFQARQAHLLLVCPDVENPSYLYFNQATRVLYAISELWGGAEGRITALSLDPSFSGAQYKTELSTAGTIPCYISLVPDGYLLVANYGDGSIASFALRKDGHLAHFSSILKFNGSGPNTERQQGPHSHCVLPHPSNGFIYVADLGTDSVYRCRIDPIDGSLQHLGEVRVPPGSGPRHMLFHPSGTTAFLVHELSSHLGTLRVEEDGRLRQVGYQSLLPADHGGASFGADLAISADGAHLYVTNRGHDSVSVFRVDRLTHQASVVGWQPSEGNTPRSLALAPSGEHLLVANQDSDSVQIFRIAPETGELSPAFSISVPTPVCVKCSSF
jgi:6-phosphogluconolactonase